LFFKNNKATNSRRKTKM